MANHNFFTVDLGATSGRTILACYDGAKMEMTEITRFENPILPLGGHLFWNLPHLYNEIIRGLTKVASQAIRLDSIGIDTWGCDFAFFGGDGQLLGLPYCYRDPHTDGAQERFFAKMPSEELYRRTGIQFMNFNSVFQMDTLQRNGCTALEAAEKVLLIPDALSYMLTGEAICEYTVATTSQMVDAQTGDLDLEILKALGLERSRFGRMVRPGERIGVLSPQVQQAVGMGPVPVIAVAGHDTACAVAAVPAESSDFAYLSCGTWSLLGVETPSPIIADESFRENFTNEGGVDGTIRFLKNICGMWIFEQCRKDFRNAPENVGELVALAGTTDFASLIDPDAECFAHPSSMTSAIDDYCRATAQAVPASPAEYCRLIFRSLAFRCRQVVGLLRELTPVRIEALNVIGGGSRNAFLMQCLADALGLKVICGPVEGTAMGNALVQAKAAGLCDSLSSMRKISKASVELTEYLPRQNMDGEYACFLEIQKNYYNTL